MRLPVHDRLAGGRLGSFPNSTALQGLISTLLITIIVESIIVLGYCIWSEKPVRPILLTSICANIVTQSLLWGVLSVFFQHYIIALLITEAFIWVIESLTLYFIPTNQLRCSEAMSLGLSMNLVSFALGWFLPV